MALKVWNTGDSVLATDLNGNFNLKADDDAVVHNTGNENIAGVKTFASFPITPSSAPTTNYQTANKKYADDRVATKIPTSYLDTDGTLAANSDSKIATQKATKTYVGTQVATAITIIKCGKTTHDASVTGDQTIAHGLGKTPKLVRIKALLNQGGYNHHLGSSDGSYDGTNQACVYSYVGVASSPGTMGVGNSSTKTVYLIDLDASSKTCYASVAVDGTNITLTWNIAESGTPTGTVYMSWEALG